MTRRPALLDWALAALAAGAQLATWFAMARQAHDAYDSAIYEWSWIWLPVVAVGLGIARPSTPVRLWAAALIFPWMVMTYVAGVVWFDPSEGASFWFAGEVMLLVAAGWLAAWGAAAAAWTRRLLRT